MSNETRRSEEKLYMVKNDKGYYWDFNNLDGLWKLSSVSRTVTVSEENAKNTVKHYGGHIVTLIEEPEKVNLPKKAAEWIDRFKDGGYDITYIFTEYAMPNEVSDWLEDSDDDAEHREERGLMLINAYLYGYTVEKDKKYYVKVPHTDDSYFYKVDGEYCNAGDSYHLEGMTDKKWFTDAEIEHYGLQDCEKVECDNDD